MDNTDRDARLLKYLAKFWIRLFAWLAAAWVAMVLALEQGLGEMMGLVILFIGWLVYFTSSVFFRLSQIEQRLADKEQDAPGQP